MDNPESTEARPRRAYRIGFVAAFTTTYGPDSPAAQQPADEAAENLGRILASEFEEIMRAAGFPDASVEFAIGEGTEIAP